MIQNMFLLKFLLILKRFSWSWGQKTHLAHRVWCSLLIETSSQPEVVQTCYSTHGVCLSVYYEGGVWGGLSKALYANELLINYLLNFPSRGGRRLEYCSIVLCPLSSCLPSIKASLSGDWLRWLISLQANAEIIYLLWDVCMTPGGNICHP